MCIDIGEASNSNSTRFLLSPVNSIAQYKILQEWIRNVKLKNASGMAWIRWQNASLPNEVRTTVYAGSVPIDGVAFPLNGE